MTAADREEFAAVWRQVERQVLARIRRERDLLQRLGEDEHDVAHDVSVAMLEAYRRSGGITYPVTLAHRITSCALASRIRKRQSRPDLVELNEVTEPGSVAIAPPSIEVEEREADSEFTELRLLRLGRTEDRALALKEEGCSRAQIAGQLRMPERDVATTLQRARRKLTDARAQRDARGLCSLVAPVIGSVTAAASQGADDRVLTAAVLHATRCPRCRRHLVALRRAQRSALAVAVSREVAVSEPGVMRLNGHESRPEPAPRAA